jgi:hypothetical protein
MNFPTKWLTFAGSLTIGLSLLMPAVGVAQTEPAATPDAHTPEQGRQADHSFGELLGQHPEMREELNKNPNLVNDPKYVANHPELQQYMQQHPDIAQHLKAHPQQVMHREQHYAEAHHTMQHHPNQRNH